MAAGMRLAAALICLVAALLPAASGRAAEPALASLGALEREAVTEALALRGLTVDPAPDGKTVRAIHVVNLDVFSKRDGIFQILNRFHRTTREWAIRREVLIEPGERYEAARVDETIRALQDPNLSNVVVALPVRAPDPTHVDLLVVTRDVWSLRLNTDFEYQQNELIYFTASLSENNLLGWRKSAAVVFDMDQGRMSLGPTYVDPNIAGTRLSLSASYRVHYAREIGELRAGDREGSAFRAALSYPLYSLRSRWGGFVDAGAADGVVRRFAGSELRPAVSVPVAAPPLVPGDSRPRAGCWRRGAFVPLADDPGAPVVAPEDRCPGIDTTTVPWMYRLRTSAVTSGVTRSFPGSVIQRITAGHAYALTRPGFVAGFPSDEPTRALFASRVFPRSERTSAVYLRYALFVPRYRTYRDYGTFDLRENARLGPDLDLSVSRALAALGSERSFGGFGAGGGWSFDLADGFQRLAAGWQARHENGRLVDQSASASVSAASPVLARSVRLVAQLGGDVLFDSVQNRYLSLGGDNGLRGYAVGDFIGTGARFLGHLEVRSMPLTVASLRLGGLVFYDVGHAASSIRALVPHHDVGLGLRVLIPQLNAYVLRFDWAVATHDTFYTRAGLPGRVSIGFRQVF